jgi:Domain of unknown function (DUF4169)
MTADIVNLRMARKQKVRAERLATAAENRVRSGQSKAQKQASRAMSELETRKLDQAKREPSESERE